MLVLLEGKKKKKPLYEYYVDRYCLYIHAQIKRTKSLK